MYLLTLKVMLSEIHLMASLKRNEFSRKLRLSLLFFIAENPSIVGDLCKHLQASVIVMQEGSSKYQPELNAFLDVAAKKKGVEIKSWSADKRIFLENSSIIGLKSFGK